MDDKMKAELVSTIGALRRMLAAYEELEKSVTYNLGKLHRHEADALTAAEEHKKLIGTIALHKTDFENWKQEETTKINQEKQETASTQAEVEKLKFELENKLRSVTNKEAMLQSTIEKTDANRQELEVRLARLKTSLASI